MLTAKKYPSTPHWYKSPGVQRDDSYHTNPDMFLEAPIVITEKLDGGNTLLCGGEVYARSVTSPSHAGWMAMVRKHHAWKTYGTNNLYYGEDLYGIHSIEYDALKEDETYRLFSVRDQDDIFLSWDDVEEEAENTLGVKTVPVLFRGEFKEKDEITEWFETHIKKPSCLGGEREGFVMRIQAPFYASSFSKFVCKYVRENHVQTDEHWTKNWKPCNIIR